MSDQEFRDFLKDFVVITLKKPNTSDERIRSATAIALGLITVKER